MIIDDIYYNKSTSLGNLKIWSMNFELLLKFENGHPHSLKGVILNLNLQKI